MGSRSADQAAGSQRKALFFGAGCSVKERPILFNSAMVRAIIEGRKTQTRGAVKPRKDMLFGCLLQPHELAGEVNAGDYTNCLYGQPSDRLWVRETFQGPLLDADTMENEYRGSPDDFHKPEYCVYAADGGSPPEFVTLDDDLVCRWRPSIHMPRWASRINLEITSVRVEKLQDISESNAKAEGCRIPEIIYPDEPRRSYSYVAAYRHLWESIHGPGSWDANPWVLVVEFNLVEP